LNSGRECNIKIIHRTKGRGFKILIEYPISRINNLSPSEATAQESSKPTVCAIC
ncbi:hypothetical protein C0J52_14138, partial [Blattella germanica]